MRTDRGAYRDGGLQHAESGFGGHSSLYADKPDTSTGQVVFFESEYLNQKINDFEIDYWSNHSELISSIWKDLIESEISSKYLQNSSNSFEIDQSFLVNIYRKSIAPNKKLYEFFEDNEISWINDLPLVNSLVLSSIKNMKKTSKKFPFMKDIYKNKEDANFGIQLIRKVIENKSFLEDEISKVTLNWDNDRIAQIDLLLLQMCLTEFLYFKSIPVKASINEYLEIAKEYSSKKSNVFINGILFHHYYPNNIIINYYDTLTNIFFYLYMNYYSQVQPYGILLTLLIFCVFYINQNYLNKSNFIHVFCIQLASLQLYYDANLLK